MKAVDVATIVSPVVATVLWLVSPQSVKAWCVRHARPIKVVIGLLSIWGMFRVGWLQHPYILPLWVIILIGILPVTIGLWFVKMSSELQKNYAPQTEIFNLIIDQSGNGLQFSIVNNQAQYPPRCIKCEIEMRDVGSRGREQWECRLCPISFNWEGWRNGPLSEEIEARMNAQRRKNKAV